MDRILFLKKFIDEPKKIGSLTPSSRFLADKMLQDLPWEKFSHVAELRANRNFYRTETRRHFVMFQYSLQMKTLLREYFYSVETNFFLLNFPPAFVYLCKK